MAVLVRNHYMRHFSFLFEGRLSSAVGNDDVHRSAGDVVASGRDYYRVKT